MVLTLMKNKYNRGKDVWDYFLNFDERRENETYDRYFCELTAAAVSDDGEPLSFGIFMGYPNGDSMGCFWRDTGDSSPVLALSIQDGTTNGCRKRYNITADSHRNLSEEWIDSRQCGFNINERPWYIQAVNQANVTDRDKLFWTRPYTFSHGEIGVTAIQIIWDDDGSGSYTLSGILAFDVLLMQLSTFLSTIEVGVSSEEANADRSVENHDVPHDTKGEMHVFVLERTIDPKKNDYNFIASSTMSITEELYDATEHSFYDVITARKIEDEDAAETLAFLTMKGRTSDESPAWEDIQNATFIPRRTSDPMTLAVGLSGEEAHGVDWIVVMAVPKEEFWGSTDRNNRMALLCGTGTSLVLLYVLRIVHKFIKSSRERAIKETKIQNQCGVVKISEVATQKLLNVVMDCNVTPRSTVLDCYHMQSIPSTDESSSLRSTERCEQCEKRKKEHRDALQHIKFASAGINNLAYFRLISKSRTQAKLFQITRKRIYVMTIHFAVLCHIMLSFFKPHNLTEVNEFGFHENLMAAEWILLLIETIDIGLKLVILIELKDFNGDDYLEKRALYQIFAARCVLNFVIFVDLILMAAIPISLEYYLPLRWLIMLLLNPGLLRAASSFAMAVVEARDVLLLYSCLIFVCATMLMVMFRCTPASIESEECDQYQLLGQSKSNFLFAFVTAFIYISTGENYADVANEGIWASKWNIIFFAIFTVFGMFFVMALVAGFFQIDFEAAKKTDRRFYKLMERTGTISAFLVLADQRPPDGEIRTDINQTLPHFDLRRIYITVSKYNDFLHYCGTLDPDDESQEGKRRRKTKLNAFEFLTKIEQIEVKKLTLDRRKKELRIKSVDYPGVWDDKLRALFITEAWRRTILAIVFVYMWLLTLYGTTTDEWTLDLVIGLLIIVQTVEIVTQFIVFGGDFWFWAYYPKHWSPPFESAKEDVIIEGRPLRRIPAFSALDEAQEAALNTVACQGIVFAKGTKGIWEYRLMGTRKLVEGEEGTAVWLKPPQSEAIQARKVREANHKMLANQVEAVIVFATFVFWGITHALDGSISYSEERSGFRFFTTLPILRVFTQVHGTRTIVFTLFGVLPTFTSIFVLLLMVFYIYGFYGMAYFSGQFTLYDLEGIPDAHFETLMSSIITLFQFNVGDSLDTMERVIEVTDEYSIFYFMTFTILVIVLFANLFFGLILGTVSELIEQKGDESQINEDRSVQDIVQRFAEKVEQFEEDIEPYESQEDIMEKIRDAMAPITDVLHGKQTCYCNCHKTQSASLTETRDSTSLIRENSASTSRMRENSASTSLIREDSDSIILTKYSDEGGEERSG